MPRTDLWELNPMSMTVGAPELQNVLDEERKRQWDSVKNMEVTGLDINEYGRAQHFFDPDTNEWMFGQMDAESALFESMSASYTAGIFARNAASQVSDAQNLSRGRDKDAFVGTMMEFDEDAEFLITDFLNTSKVNIAAAFQGGKAIPFVEQWYDAPDELLIKEAPLGWSVAEAIALLADRSPESYEKYRQVLGGEEGIQEVVKDANNPYMFWWKLNTAVQNRAFASSMEYLEKNTGFWERNYLKGKNFVVAGILNDPDMVVSLGIGAALNVVTAGSVGSALIAARIGQKFHSLSKWEKSVNRITKLSSVVHGSRAAVMWLPENIGPHLMNKYVFKNVQHKGIGRFLANRTADAGEGLFTGGLAEYFNQSRQIKYGKREEFSASEIWTEAYWEAIFSPVINPTMGLAMRIPGDIGGVVMGNIPQTMARSAVGTRTYDLIQKSFVSKQMAGEANIELKRLGKMRQQFATATGQDFHNTNMDEYHAFNSAVALLQLNEQQTDATTFEERIEQVLNNVVDGLDGPMSDIEIADKMISDYEATYGFSTKEPGGIYEMRALLRMRLQLDKSRKLYNADNRKNLGLEEYIDHVEQTGDYLQVFDPVTQQAIQDWWKKQKVNKDKQWADTSTDDKVQAAVDMQLELAEAVQALEEQYRVDKEGAQEQLRSSIDTVRESLGQPTRDQISTAKMAANTEKKRSSLQEEVKNLDEEVKSAAEFIGPPTQEALDAQARRDEASKDLDTFNAQNPPPGVDPNFVGPITVDQSEMEANRDGDVSLDPEIESMTDKQEAESKLSGLIKQENELQAKIREAQDQQDRITEEDLVKEMAKVTALKRDLTESLDTFIKQERDAIERRGGDPSIIADLDVVLALRRRLEKAEEVLREANKDLYKLRFAIIPVALHELQLAINENSDLFADKGEVNSSGLTAEGRKNIQELIDNIPDIGPKIDYGIYRPRGRQSTRIKNLLSNFLNKPGAKLNLKDLAEIGTFIQESLAPHIESKIENSQEGKALAELKAEEEKAWNAYNVALAKNWQVETKHNRSLFITMEKLRQVVKQRKTIKTGLNQRAEIFNGLVKTATEQGRSTLKFNEIRGLIPKTSTYWSRVLRKSVHPDNIELYKEKEYTITEARTIFEEASEEVRKYANKLQIGMSRHMMSLDSFSSLDAAFAHDVDEDYIFDVEQTIDEYLDETDIGLSDAEQATRDLYVEAGELEDFYAQLKLFKSRYKNNIPAGLVNAVMPVYFDKVGGKAGIGLFSFFKKHIIWEGNLHEDMTPGELWLAMDRIKFDLKGVIQTTKIAMLRTHVGLGKWSEALARKGMDDIVTDLTDEGGKDSIYNLINSTRVITRLEQAQKVLNTRLFQDFGFVLARDEDGFPTRLVKKGEENRVTESQWLGKVREAMEKRIALIIENQGVEKTIRNIQEIYPTFLTTESEYKGLDKTTYVIKTIYNELERKINDFSPDEEFHISDMGNGKRDWQSADEVGKALVDMITGKELVTKSPLYMMDPDEALKRDIDEYEANQHPSLQVTLPMDNQSNRAAPISPRDLFRNYQNYKWRKRVQAVVDEKLTPAKRRKLYAWIEKKSKVLFPDKVGEDLHMAILPTVVGTALHERVIGWEELKQFYRETMLEMPMIGIGHIHDEMTAAKTDRVDFAAEYRINHPGVSAGSSLIVPFGKIGEIMALESSWSGFKGLTKASIIHAARIVAQHIESGKPIGDLYAPEHYKDRSFSGLMEIKLLAMAGIGEGISLDVDGVTHNIDEVIDGLIKGTIADQYGGVELDFYRASGSFIAAQIDATYRQGLDVKDTAGGLLSKFNNVFRILRRENSNEFMTMEEWGAEVDRLNELGDEESLKKVAQFKAVREFFKVPVMRRLYQGGMNSFMTEFRPSDFRDFKGQVSAPKGVQALLELEDQFGVNFSEAEVVAIGEQMFKEIVNHHSIMFTQDLMNTAIPMVKEGITLDAAMGMMKGTKSAAINLLRMDIRGTSAVETMVRNWVDKVRIWSNGEKTGLSESHPLYKVSTIKDSWESVMDDMTDKVYGRAEGNEKAWEKNRKAVAKMYEPRLKKARKYLDDLPDGFQLIPGSKEWKELEMIMYGNVDGEAGEGPRKLYKSLGYFKGLNIKNRTAHKLNIERMKRISEYMGIQDFDSRDFLGLGNFLLYHTALPTVGSYRVTDRAAGHGMNTQGAFWERIAKNPDMIDPEVATKDSIFHIEAKKLRKTVDELTLEEKQLILAEYMEQNSDNLDALGMSDIVNNPYFGNDASGKPKYTKEQFDQLIEDLMLKNMLIQYSSYDKPPLTDYTAEDVEGQLEQEWLKDMYLHTRRREKTLKSEMAQEEDWLNKGSRDSRWMTLLGLKAKTGRIVNPGVARALGVSLSTFTKMEYPKTTVHEGKKALSKHTGNLLGPLSMQPKYKQVSFHDKGMFFLQKLEMQRQQKEILGPHMLAEEMTFENNEDAFIPRHHFGYTQPWKRESLPKPLPIATSYLQNIRMDNEAGIKAGQLMGQLFRWADSRGYLETIEKDPTTLPYFVNIMNSENIRRKNIRRLNRSLTPEAAEAEIISERINYLLELHNLTYLSRDIKRAVVKGQVWSPKGRPLSTVEGLRTIEKRLLANDKTLIMEDLLTNPLSETNPTGYILDPTLIHEQLEYGLVAREGMTLTGENITDNPDVFVMTDLHLVSAPIQSHDFNRFMLAMLYDNYIQEIILTNDDFTHLREFAGNPNAWDVEISVEEQQQLVDLAFLKAEMEHGGLNIEFLIPQEMIKTISSKDDVQQINIMLDQVRVIRRNDGVEVDVTQGLRHSFSNVGFGFQTVAPRAVIGQNVKLALTFDAAIGMMALLENQKDLATINLGMQSNKNINTKMSDASKSKWVRAKLPSDYAEEALGRTEEARTRETVLSSEAMEMIARAIDPNAALPTVTNVHNKIDGVPIEVVDLDAYRSSPVEGMSHVVTEMYIAPIQNVLNRIRRNNVSHIAEDGLAKIEKLIVDVRREPHHDARRTELILLSAMVDIGDSVLTKEMIEVVLNKKALPAKQAATIIKNAHDTASSLYRSIVNVAHDKHAYYKNPLSDMAREFLWSYQISQESTIQNSREAFVNKIMEEIRTGEEGVSIDEQTLDLSALVDSYGNFESPKGETYKVNEDTIKFLANQAYDFALVEQASDYNQPQREWFGDIQTYTNDVVRVSRTSENLRSYALEQGGKDGNPDLERLGSQIDNLTVSKEKPDNFLDAKGARILRAVILRMYTYDPMSLHLLNFDEGTLTQGVNQHLTLRGESKRIGDRVEITVDKELKGQHHKALTVLVHELAHAATFKYLALGSPEYNTWLRLHNSKKGRIYLEKMVIAWEGGIRTARTDKLVEYYMSEPKEFVAAMVQFHLLNEVAEIPMDMEWTDGDNTVHQASMGLLKKVMHYAQEFFLRISSVFTNFKKEDPDLYSRYKELTERALGWDAKAGETIAQTTEPAWTKANFVESKNEQPIFQQQEGTVSDSEYQALINRRNELDNQRQALDKEGKLDEFADANELFDLEADLEAHGGEASLIGETTRLTYFETIARLKQRFAPEKGGNQILDLKRMLQSEGVGITEQTVVMEYIVRRLRDVFGDPMTANAAVAGRRSLEWLSKLVGKDKGYAQQMLTDVMVGQTGATKTWSGLTIFQQLFSALLDDRVVMTMNGISRFKGMPSVSRHLNELDLVGEQMRSFNLDLEEISNKQDDTIAMQTELIHLVDNPDHTISLPDRFTPQQVADATEIIEHASGSMSRFLRDLIKRGNDIGIFSGGFETLVPYRFNDVFTGNTEVKETFQDLMKRMIFDRLTSSMIDPKGKVDGATLYTSKQIPSVSSPEAMVKDIKRLVKTPHTRNFIYHLMSDILGPDGLDKLGTATEPGQINEQIKAQIDVLGEGVEGEKLVSDVANIRAMLMDRIQSFIGDAASGKISWTQLGVMSKSPASKWHSDYEAAITANTDPMKLADQSIITRINELSIEGSQHLSHVYHRVDPDSQGPPLSGHAGGIRSVVDLHYFNLESKASRGLYFPNDAWAVPRFSDLADHPKSKELTSALMTNPHFLVTQFKKSKGDSIIEIKMMREAFGVHGDYGDVLSLARTVVAQAVSIKHPNGEAISDHERQDLKDGINQLEGKWGFVRGITTSAKATDRFSQWLMDVAPSITKIAYGGNLALASGMVEGTFSAMIELFGRQSITGFARTFISPLLPLNKTVRKKVARDLLHQIEAVTQGYVPDFQRPSQAAQDSALTRLIKLGGRGMMWPAKQTIQGIAISRAITLRLAITDMWKSGKLEKLVYKLQGADIKTDRDLLKAMRSKDVGISRKELNVVKLMIEAGLFLDAEGGGSWNAFNDIFNKFGVADESYYGIGDLLNKFNTTKSSSDGDYRSALEVMTKLRGVEKAFIEQVLISPNAFDIYTGANKGGQGVMDTIWEIFRRYPVLFTSQKFIRAGGQMNPAMWGLQLMSLIILDILYMMMLRIAAGEEPNEILDDFDKNPKSFIATYGFRIPIMGRWVPILGQIVKSVITDKPNRQESMIPLSAFGGIIQNIKDVLGSAFTDQEMTGEEWMKALRNVPGIGDTLVRLAYNLGKSSLDSENKTKGMSHRTKMEGFKNNGGNFGMTEGLRQATPEWWIGELIKELFGGIQPSVMDTNMYKQLVEGSPRPTTEPTQAPPEPVGPKPVEPTSPVNTSDGILRKIAAQEGVSGDLALRLRGRPDRPGEGAHRYIPPKNQRGIIEKGERVEGESEDYYRQHGYTRSQRER